MTCFPGLIIMSVRKQLCNFPGYQSRSNTITYGAPQGSILGLKLFSIFVNDLPESITSGDLFMFADDTTIICRLCRKQYAHRGLWHMRLVSLELLQCDLELNKEHEHLIKNMSLSW